jgi:hypothetical protein
MIEPLVEFATTLGFTVSIEPVRGSAGGFCDADAKRIVVDAAAAINGQVRVLGHEIAHAMGVDYQQYTREQAEVIVDTVTFIVCAGVGLAVDGESIPYVAGWGEDGALEAVTEYAGLIDSLAGRIEGALQESLEDA